MRKTDLITSELLRKCSKDDRKSIKLLYEVLFGQLMPVCMRYHSHEEDARSSFHLGFMKILKNLDNAPEMPAFLSWSKRITVNTLIDEYRKHKKYNSRVIGKETERELEIHGTHTNNSGEAAMGYETVLQLLKDLPNVTQQVFNLYVIEGFNHREIGEMLDMSEGTSKWHLSTGRKMLREKLEKMNQFTTKMAL